MNIDRKRLSTTSNGQWVVFKVTLSGKGSQGDFTKIEFEVRTDDSVQQQAPNPFTFTSQLEAEARIGELGE